MFSNPPPCRSCSFMTLDERSQGFLWICLWCRTLAICIPFGLVLLWSLQPVSSFSYSSPTSSFHFPSCCWEMVVILQGHSWIARSLPHLLSGSFLFISTWKPSDWSGARLAPRAPMGPLKDSHHPCPTGCPHTSCWIEHRSSGNGRTDFLIWFHSNQFKV